MSAKYTTQNQKKKELKHSKDEIIFCSCKNKIINQNKIYNSTQDKVHKFQNFYDRKPNVILINN